MISNLDNEKFIVNNDQKIEHGMKKIDINMNKIVFVVSENNKKLVGSLSDGDIRRYLLRKGDIKDTISKACNKNPIFARESYLNSDLERILKNKSNILIPVINNERRIVRIINQSNSNPYPIYKPFLCGNEMEYVIDCLDTNWISSQGKYVRKFESQFDNLLNDKFTSISVCNGTAALFLALKAFGIGKDDKVAVPLITFAATANAVLHTGAEPVFVDIDKDTWCLDPNQLRETIKLGIKAFISVDLFGNSCNSKALRKIADESNIFFIEDAAEALGTKYQGEHIGNLSDAVTFSFFGNKTVTTGEGGMVSFKLNKFAEKARILRDHGMDPNRKYWHTIIGYNLRITNIQSAIGVAQMERLDKIIEQKVTINNYYKKYLSPEFIPQKEEFDTRSTWWLNSFLLPKSIIRDKFIEICKQHDLDVRPGFYMLNQMPCFENYSTVSQSISSDIHKRIICFPSFISISESDIKEISKIANNALSIS